jgi:hypothetical protein
MRRVDFLRFLFVVPLAMGIGFAGAVKSVMAEEAKPAGTIDFEIYKAGFIVGISGGSGTLHFQGADYALSIGGVSLGATVGASKAELIGEVYNLKALSDIEGIYTAGQAGAALAGGVKVTELKNSKGVVLKAKGKQIGLELSLDLNGMEISLKK